MVQLPCGLQVLTERFFDNHPPPLSVVLLRQARRAKLLHSRREKIWRRRQVKEIIPACAVFLIYVGQQLLQLLIRGRLLEITGEIVQPLGKPVPQTWVTGAHGELLHFLRQLFAKGLVRQTSTRDPYYGELLGQEMFFRQVI